MSSKEYNELKDELAEAMQIIQNLGIQLTGLTTVVRTIALTHPNRADLAQALEDSKLRLEATFGEEQLSDQTIQSVLAPLAEFQQLLRKPPEPLVPFSLPTTS